MRKILICFIVVFLTGCAVKKNYSAIGGSRADGIIQLSYDMTQFEMPQPDEQQGITLARRKCNAWGYSGAEPFEGTVRTCNETTLSSCSSWRITKDYQCLGDLEK